MRQVGRLDRVHDQPPGHPVQGHGQADRVIEAETVRAGRPARSGRRPVQHEAMHPARVRRLGPDRVDDHGERGPGPGLDQPGGLAVGDHQFRAGRGQVAEGGYDRGPGAVVVSWNLPAIRLTYSADGNDLDLVHVQDFSVGEEIIWIIGEDQGPTVPCDRS